MIEAWIVSSNPNTKATVSSQVWLLKTGLSGPRVVPPEAIRRFIKQSGKKVFTLAGYADAGYQEPARVNDHVRQALAHYSPESWLICIGATVGGIGDAYRLAKEQGFTTLGIVSTLALSGQAELSSNVDYVFFVEDDRWGGLLPNGDLSPTSSAYVKSGNEFLAIGGNVISRDEMLAAQRMGKPVSFLPADMNHERALQLASRYRKSPPDDFKGLAHDALMALQS